MLLVCCTSTGSLDYSCINLLICRCILLHKFLNFQLYTDGKLSLNSGIVTFLNYGNDVTTAVSYSTFAHEIGHNFGSWVRKLYVYMHVCMAVCM